MKKAIILLCLVVSCFSIAQQTLSVNQVTGDHSVFNGIVSTTGKQLTYDDIQGSPYLNKNFFTAKVGENFERIPVRYNSYKDEIEFQKGGKILVLPKQNEFSKIEIQSPKQTFVFIDSNDEMKGYFIELIKDKYSLYKKERIIFRDFIPAANSYASDKLASFKTQDPIYYIKTQNTFVKAKNQKEIMEQFPNKREILTSFFKSNKIKLDKEEDLIKLVNFLNQN